MIDSNIKIPNSKKILAFRYIIYKLHENGFENIWLSDGNVSKLVTQKLLFAVCLASNTDNEYDSLFQTFDNFYALKLGHIENDVLTDLNQNTSDYKIDAFTQKEVDLEDNSLEEKILTSIKNLIDSKPSIKHYRSSELIEFSHSYKSWINAYSRALCKGGITE